MKYLTFRNSGVKWHFDEYCYSQYSGESRSYPLTLETRLRGEVWFRSTELPEMPKYRNIMPPWLLEQKMWKHTEKGGVICFFLHNFVDELNHLFTFKAKTERRPVNA